METLRRQPVVRESEVFAALFPRGFTPQQLQHRAKGSDALPTLHTANKQDETRATGEAANSTLRVPKLGLLSPKTPRALMAALPMTASDCATVWKFLSDWVTAQIAMEATASIPGFGTVRMRTQALKIRMPFFEPDPGFVEKHGLHAKSAPTPHAPRPRAGSSSAVGSPRTCADAANIDLLSFNFLEMAACCGKHVVVAKAKDWLQTVLQKLGEAMRQCDRVELGLGVGVVACTNGVIENLMLPRHTNASSKVPPEVRTGASPGARSRMVPSSPKVGTAQTFLTGSTFSSAIRLHAAVDKQDNDSSGLFALDAVSPARHRLKQPLGRLTTVLPGSPSAGNGASPRTRRLRNHPPNGEHAQQQDDKGDANSPHAEYPALFDSISRTFCVEPDLNLSFLQPSNRIASNFAPVAAGLFMAKHTQRSGANRITSGCVAFTEEILPRDPPYPTEPTRYGALERISDDDEPDSGSQRREASEERYFAYLNNANQLMDERWLAPLPQDLVDRIVASAVKYLSSPPSGHMKAVLDSARDEFVSNYHVSVKKAILDYLLVRSATRERLAIFSGTPSYSRLPLRWQLGDNKGINGCMGDLKALAAASHIRLRGPRPFSPRGKIGKRSAAAVDSSLLTKKRHRKHLKQKLASAFVLTDPQVRVLQYIWYDFEADLLLVKLPDPCGQMKPLDLHAFERTQLAHASQVRAFMMEHWYHRAKQMFEQAVTRSTAGGLASSDAAKLKHLLNAVAAQMSLQIRSLIFKSIRAYAAFFELFGKSSDEHSGRGGGKDVASRSCQTGTYSALLISLSLLDGGVQFQTPLIEIPSILLSVLHNLPQLFHNVNRVETQFQTSLESLFTASGTDARYSPFLWNVSSEESEIVATTARIRQIIDQNLVQLHQLQAEYSIYGAAFRQISTASEADADDGMDESISDDKLEEWRSELQSVRDVALSLVRKTRSSRHLNLFCVECQTVNNDLLAAFSAWMYRHLSAFAEGTSSFNARLRQQYKDFAARLAKRPLDLYELVDAEAFVESLKTSKLQELQTKVDDVKQRMQFLLFHREDVHVDGPDDGDLDPVSRKSTVFVVPNELLGSAAKTIRWRTHIERLLQEAEASLVGERARIEAVFLAKRNRFLAEMEEFDAEVKSFSKKGDVRHAATYVVQLSKMKDAIVGFKRQMESIAEEETKLQWKPTDFSKLDDMAEEMEPYEQLWKTAREFRELNSRWLRTNVFELQAHEGLQTLQQMMATISAVSNQLQLNSAAAAITADLIKKQMCDFRENAKIAAAILNPSVQERHLNEISMLLALTIDPAEPITLLKLLENGAFDHVARIVEVSENATLEKQIEDALKIITLEWQDVRIHFKATKSSASSDPNTDSNATRDLAAQAAQRRLETVPLAIAKTSVSDIKLLVEDHQMRLQTLQCLPHAVPFSHEISRWLLYLHDLYLILDLLLANERLWKRIAPLFVAGIIENEAEESMLFSQADTIHRSVCCRVEGQPVCLNLVQFGSNPSDFYQLKPLTNGSTNDDDGSAPRRHQVLLSDLRQCRDLLERAGANISVGFEARRAQFPRFYLLSDSELVAALANRPTNDTDSVASSPHLWRHLQLCFPGIQRIQANVQQELTAFVSAHGEFVPISSPIPTKDVGLATWLTKLETSMTTILQACTRAAINDFARKEFRKWCLLWPEQVLLTTIQYAWTMQGELHNQKSTPTEAQQAWRTEVQSLAENVNAVTRELKAAATSSMRFALSNVILLLHQLRDVSMQIVDELSTYPQPHPSLTEEDDVTTLSSLPASVASVVGPFETATWLAQPRFYYDAGAALGVKFLSFSPVPYGFEYCGNAAPPVHIIPLTLRCFHALALHANVLHRGSHLSGSSGVGKKTSCAALARLCGRLLVHFDCMDTLHRTPLERFHTLVQFLKGTASCGAWLMMTSLEQLHHAHLLSLFTTICGQIMDCHAANLTHCTVLDAKLRLKKGLHFVVVSPPSAAMRSSKHETTVDLPELRSAFRPVHVLTHDLGLIVEFFLLEYKILHAKTLAKLIAAATRVLSHEIEVLSTGDTGSVSALRNSLVNIRALREIAKHSASLCAQERLALHAVHGWPLSTSSGTPSFMAATQQTAHVLADGDMPVELVRALETMETQSACAAIRDFVGARLPAQSLQLVDFVLRDFTANTLVHERHASRSFFSLDPLPESQTPSDKFASIRSGLSPALEQGEFQIERAIKRVIEAASASESFQWVPSNDVFCQKAVHLFQALQTHRAVVVVGEIQSGKTTLWRALSHALTCLSEEGEQGSGTSADAGGSTTARGSRQYALKRTRSVVVHPRAVTCDQLFGSLSRNAMASSDTLITNLIRDAKPRLHDEETWLVLDGDISDTWADRMLQVTEVSDTDADSESRGEDAWPSRSRRPGLLLPSREKRATLPVGMLLLIETTVLKDASPAFIAKVGVVHTGRTLEDSPLAKLRGARADWRHLYTTWKCQHRTTFSALYSELVSLLDTSMDETMDASINFVSSEFGDALRMASTGAQPLLLRWRIRSFFALLHSLLSHSWAKLSAMVSGKQRKIAMHCYFLQALMWGIGHTSDPTERLKFHGFVRQWIISGPRSADSALKRVLVLFFPSGTMGSAASGLSHASGTQARLDLMGAGGGTAAAMNKETLYNFGFAVELGTKWIRWPEFYDAWLADRCQLGADKSSGVSGGVSPVPYRRGDRLFVRTPSMAAAVYFMHQLMAAGYPAVLCGPRDAGKSTCGQVGLDLHATIVDHERSNAAVDGTSGTRDGMKDPPVENQFVYSGVSVSASNVREQLDTLIERKRVEERRAPPIRDDVGVDQGSAPKGHDPVTRCGATTLVFIDDLHCLPPNQSSDCTVELMRGLVEHSQLVHPKANTIMHLDGRLALFAALQHDGSRRVSQDLHRVLARFIPIALPSHSDLELTSICSAFLSSQTERGQGDSLASALVPDAPGLSSASQEAAQLITTVIKATLKLFRVLSSDQWTFPSSNHFHAAAHATKTYAATTAFQPSKAHYVFHTHDMFRVLQHVCCASRQTFLLGDKSLVAKLWCHEAARVFGDRLSDVSDVNLFYNLLQDTVVSSFNLAPDGLMGTTLSSESSAGTSGANNPKNHAQVAWLRDQLHFSFIGESSGAGMVDGYREVHELQKVELSIERSMMSMYRANVTTEALSFVLCTHAIRHILRITRVLRHHNDQHLVLIGRRGSKMLSLTRLAAFICQKSTASYCVQRGHGSEPTSWKASLKSVLLRCVRQPRDERLVFIVKDMWLDDLGMYATLDRFFSGGKLLADVISHDDFDDGIMQILRAEADRQRLGDALAQAATATAQDAALSSVMHSKSSAMKSFFELVRRKLQFVLIFALPPEAHESQRWSYLIPTQRLAHLLWQYPHVRKACTIDYVFEWPEDSLHGIAQKCLAATFAAERDRLVQLSQAAVQMFLQTRAAWPVWVRGERLDEDEKRRPRTSGESGGIGDPASRPSIPFTDRACALIQIDPSMLVEQISLFLAHLPRLQREVEANKTKYAAGLAFMERTEQILALEQSHQQLLQPEMEKWTAATRRMSSNLEKEKLTVNKVHHALEMETALGESQRVRLKQVEDEYEALVGVSRETFVDKTAQMQPFAVAVGEKSEDGSRFLALASSSSGSVVGTESSESMSAHNGEDEVAGTADDALSVARRKEMAANRQRRGMIRSFTAISQPATSLRQLAECVGLIFGIEPVESRDELDPDEIVMDFWGSVTRRMQTEAFWRELVDFDVRTRMTESIVARTLLICTTPEFDTALFTTIHELAVLLCQWVQACTIYARDSLLAEPKHAQLCQERLAYDAAIAQMRTRQMEMQVQVSTTSTATSMRTLSEQERRELEEKLRDNSSTLQMTTSVWKVLEPCKGKWRALHEHYTQFSVQAMGDLMLATATMVYAGSVTSPTRARLRALWSEELNKLFLVHSPVDVPRPIHQLFLLDDRTLTKWQVDGLPCQEAACLESGVLALHSFLFPVVIDPHRVATEWLKRQLSELTNIDSSDEEKTTVAVVSGHTTERKTVWQTLTQCVKKKRPLLVEDFNEGLANDLRSVVQSKHRSRFDTVNQDLSSAASRTSSSVAATGTVGLMRRRSSVSIGIGISSTAKKASLPGIQNAGALGVLGSNRCWFEVPVNAHTNTVTSKTLMECGSDACLVYFVYSETESIPAWMAPLASRVTLVRFELSAAQVRTKCMQTILDTHGAHRQALTEIHALRVDTIACDEQIETIESEILDFFSVEDPVVVYGDTAKALKVVGNRSALHALEGSKLESNKKIQLHYLRLACFSSMLKRCTDIVATWRDISIAEDLVKANGSPRFPIEWIWASLTHAMTHAMPSSTENHVGLFTMTLRQCIRAAFEGSHVPLLFDFLLSLRVNARRRLVPQALLSEQTVVDGIHGDTDRVDPSGELEHVLPRLVQLLECNDEAQVRTLCAGVTSKLLTARPADVLSVHKWRALCFLAEKVPSLRAIMTLHQQHPGGKDAWKEALALDQLLSETATEWFPKMNIELLPRLCMIAALQKKLFVHEVDAIVAHELAWNEQEAVLPVSPAHPTNAETNDEVVVNEARPPKRVVTVESDKEATTVRPWVRPHSLSELWKIYSSVNVPIVVACRPETDFVREVSEAAAQAKVSVDLATQEAVESEAFKSRLLQAIRKGQWVVLTHFNTRSEWHGIVSRVLRTIDTCDPHSDFRLWLSVVGNQNPAALGSDITTMWLTQSNVTSFSETLRHVFALLHDRFARLSAPRSRQTATKSATPSVLLVRMCLIHALVSCRGLLLHAPWKLRAFEFSDGSLLAIFQAVASTTPRNLQDETSVREHGRSLMIATYGAGLLSDSERSLLVWCVDLVLGTDFHGERVTMDAVSRTMPDVVRVIRIVDELEAASEADLAIYTERIYAAINHSGVGFHPVVVDRQLQGTVRSLRRVLEPRGLLKPAVLKPVTAQSTPSRGGGRSNPPPTMSASTQLLQSTTLLMDSLSRFVVDLEGYEWDENVIAEKFPREYKQPLNQLLLYEVDCVRAMQRSLVNAVRHLQEVANASEMPNPAASAEFAALMRGETPRSWLQLLLRHGDEEPQGPDHGGIDGVLLEDFQVTMFERHRFFQSWVDLGTPSRIPVDKFASSIECIFEVIHQQLVRNTADDTKACDGAARCLRVVRVIEDKPHAQLPVHDGTMYVSGWRLYGHLQLDIVSPNGIASSTSTAAFDPRKKSTLPLPRTPQHAVSEIRDDGTPVILEISMTCRSTTPNATGDASITSANLRGMLPLGENTMSSASSRRSSLNSNASSRRSSLAPMQDFRCPIYRRDRHEADGVLASLTEDRHDREIARSISLDLGIPVPTGHPIPQLVVSGSHLRVCSIVETNTSNGARL